MIACVSVVIPFRNALGWLSRTLAALAAQDGVTFELVAVDDGSDDGSAELIAQVWPGLRPDVPLRLLASDGQGVSAARNAGVAAAAAPFVAFLDADDLAFPGRLALQAAQLEADPALAQSLCGWRRIDAHDQPLAEVRPWAEGAGFDPHAAFLHKAVLPSAWMLRRDWFERVGGFDPSLAHAEDVDLLLRLALADAPGAWLRRCLCGYRVHGAGASRAVAPQVQGLIEVLDRRLEALPPDHVLLASAQRLRHGTRMWCGWYAWQQGDHPLALQLLRESWCLSPYGPARSWWSLATLFERQCRRDGVPLDPEVLLESPFWQQLISLLRGRPCGEAPPTDPAADATAAERHHHGWRLLVAGDSAAGLALWRRQLQADLEDRRQPPWAPWGPDRLWPWWQDQPGEPEPLARQRRRVLRWIEALLAWDGRDPAVVADLLTGLQQLLLGQVRLQWGRGRRQVEERLETLFALEPRPLTAELLARLLQRDEPAAAQALRHLLPGHDPAAAEGFAPWQPWLERCLGPDCSLCPSLAPATAPPPRPFRLHRLPRGRIWIRPPATDPWGNTLAVAVADRGGVPLEPLCRRYPLGGSACLHSDPLPSPPPEGPPLVIEGPVLAVAELSAEVYYHQLLELAPRLGLALERIAPEERPRLHLWHNAGQPALLEALGIDRLVPRQRWITAAEHPHLEAAELIVPDWLAPFGEPSPRGIDWLRERLLPPPHRDGAGDRWLWLGRAPSLRRPVWGEDAVLAAAAAAGVSLEAVDLQELSLVDQATTLAAAQVVVAPHGSALANLVFCGAGTAVFELVQTRYCPPYFHAISAHRRLRHRRIEQPQVPPPLYSDLFFDAPIAEPIVLDPDPLIDALLTLRDPGALTDAPSS
jgi:GT2 family glycosyltransferase